MLTQAYLCWTLFITINLFNDIQSISDKKPNNNNVLQFNTYPEQIHLSYGSTPDQMIVTWVTLDYVNDSVVEYGINDFKNTAFGTSEIFIDGGSEKRKINMHRVILSNLLPNKIYSKF